MSGNKKEAMFAKLIAQQPLPVEEETSTLVKDEPSAPVKPAAELPDPSPALPEPKPKTARAKSPPVPAKGKRTNPDYCQANGYVPKSLRKAVDRALLDADGLDFSSLMEDLLRKWVKSRGVSE